MAKIGLYFGSFNPIHIGHVIIANHMVEYSDLDEIWMVVTPHNPLKNKTSLLANHHRLAMVEIALEDYEKINSSSVEFNLPQPSYTVNTLAHLDEKYPKTDFCLIMGEDNLKSLHRWKNYEVILENYHVYVYPRMGGGLVAHQFVNHPKIHKIDAPIVQISSTSIRKAIADKKNILPLVTSNVWKYMDEMNFYR